MTGFAKYQELYFNFKALKPDILAKAEALQKAATAHTDSNSIENSTNDGVQVSKYNCFLKQLIIIVTSKLENPNQKSIEKSFSRKENSMFLL